MRKKVIAIIIVFMMIVMSACGKKITTNEKNFDDGYIMVVDRVNSKLIKESYKIKATDEKGKLNELLEALYSYKSTKYSSPIPDLSILEGWNIEENTVVMYFRAEYYDISLIDEILIRGAIVNTICQIKEVKDVSFVVNGAPLTIRDKVIGRMNADSFLLDSNVANSTTNVTLYFPDTQKGCLKKIVKQIPSNNLYTDEQIVVEELIVGPGNNKNLAKSMPDDTRLLNIVTKEMVCYVNLSREFLKFRDDISAEMTIYSIVNSLSELSSIGSVVINIDGETVDFYQSVPINDKLTFNYELLEEKDE